MIWSRSIEEISKRIKSDCTLETSHLYCLYPVQGFTGNEPLNRDKPLCPKGIWIIHCEFIIMTLNIFSRLTLILRGDTRKHGNRGCCQLSSLSYYSGFYKTFNRRKPIAVFGEKMHGRIKISYNR